MYKVSIVFALFSIYNGIVNDYIFCTRVFGHKNHKKFSKLQIIQNE